MAPLDTGLGPATSPAAALHGIVAACRADLLKYRTVVLTSRRAIGVHQARVALRRLRAAFGLFRRVGDGPALRALAAEAKWLAGECGPARDLQVFLAETAPGAPPIARRIARRLADIHLQRARAALSGARFEAFDRALAAFAARKPAGPFESLDDFARRALGLHHDRVLRRGRKLASLDDRRLHRLRIAVKKLRYAAEFLQPAFASPSFTSPGAKPYIEATARLQGALGSMNDRAVAGRILADLATAARPTEDVGAPLKRLARQAAAGSGRRRRKLGRAWKAFKKAKRFWQD